MLDSFWGVLSGRVPSGVSSDVSWWCVWVSVRRIFGFVLGGARFRQCNDARDLVMLSMRKNEVHGLIKDSLFYFPPTPRFVKEC